MLAIRDTTRIGYVNVLANFEKLAVHANHHYHPPLVPQQALLGPSTTHLSFKQSCITLLIIMAHLVTGVLDDNWHKSALHGSHQNMT